MKNKIILAFTDIDGVLNPHFKKVWSKASIDVYNRLYSEFYFLPIITSTWRLNHTKSKLQEIFNKQGIMAKIHDYTILPEYNEKLFMYLAIDRGKEIKQYLDTHEWDDYIIIDDKIDDIVPFVDPDKVYKCLSIKGLTDEHYIKISKQLKRQL